VSVIRVILYVLWPILAIGGVFFPLWVAYQMGRTQAAIEYAKDDEGYIDRKSCRECTNHWYCNMPPGVDSWQSNYFAEQCVQNNKCNFQTKEKKC
jgi:hypothetical protein